LIDRDRSQHVRTAKARGERKAYHGRHLVATVHSVLCHSLLFLRKPSDMGRARVV
jgi:hypothetical protein